MIIRPEASDEDVDSPSTSFKITRGSKFSDIPPQPNAPIPPLSSFSGVYHLFEYLSLNIKSRPHDIKALVEIPKGSSSEASPDQAMWVYQHLRRLPIDLTPLVTSLLPICTRESCPEMKADEWMYLCVAHAEGRTEECCAIDYILHTLDSTTTILNSKQFSSMLIDRASASHFPSLFRRLSRIFSHAYFHHRETFALCEAETSLYARFVALCEAYDLVGSTLLVIPREAATALGSTEQDPSDEEENTDEDEEEDEDDDDDDEVEEMDGESGKGRGRGQDEEDDGAGKRTRSLDRDRRAGPVEAAKASGPRPAQSEEINGTSSQGAKGAGPSGKGEESMSSSPLPRGTLGRGKQPRGTMLWSSDDPSSTPAPSHEQNGRNDLTRAESIESSIYVGPGHGQNDDETATTDHETAEESSKEDSNANSATSVEGNGAEHGNETPAASKDIIDQLQEDAQKLPDLPALSRKPPPAFQRPEESPSKPANPAASSSNPTVQASPAQDTSGSTVEASDSSHEDMEEVKLDHEPDHNSNVQSAAETAQSPDDLHPSPRGAATPGTSPTKVSSDTNRSKMSDDKVTGEIGETSQEAKPPRESAGPEEAKESD